MKVRIVSDRVVGYKVGAKVDVDKLEGDGVVVRQWLKCGLAELVKPKQTDIEVVEFGPVDEEGDA